MPKLRLVVTDALRGLAAISVVVHHVAKWTDLPLGMTANIIAWKVGGVYSVECFFVLSGLSMYWVYFPEGNQFSTRRFLVRRFFRIAPLYYAAVIGMVILAIMDKVPDWYRDPKLIAINLTLLFGVIGNSIVIGGWSIGVEVVLYLLFPMLFHVGRRLGFNLVALLGILVSLSYGVFFIDKSSLLGLQWNAYINPINHLGFYCAGMAIGAGGKILKDRRTGLFVILLGTALLLGWDGTTAHDAIGYVSGASRAVLTAAVVILVWGVFQLDLVTTIGGMAERVGLFLGKVSYSTYLTHFFVFSIINKLIFASLGAWAVLTCSVVITLIVARLLYPVEAWFIRAGKRVAP